MTTYEGPAFTYGAVAVPTDAEFRIWGEACETALDNLLTPQSSTTDWATATLPTSIGVLASGAAVYTLDDGVTPEIWLKFEWGRAHISGSVFNGQFLFRCMMALDDTFSNVVLSYSTDRPSSTYTDAQWIGTKGEGYFNLTCYSTFTSYTPCGVVVERARNNDLTVRTDEVMMGSYGHKVESTSSSSYSVGGGAMQISRIQFSPLLKDASASSSARYDMFPLTNIPTGPTENPVAPLVWHSLGSGRTNPMMGLAGVKSSIVPGFQELDVSINGVDVPFRSSAPSQAIHGVNSHLALHRWE